jgi:hypothetical protein
VAARSLLNEYRGNGQVVNSTDNKQLSIKIEEEKMAKQNASIQTKPNILFIMADDIGWSNIGAYHRGLMSGRTPNLDKLAAEGMMFTDYYADVVASIFKDRQPVLRAFSRGVQ